MQRRLRVRAACRCTECTSADARCIACSTSSVKWLQVPDVRQACARFEQEGVSFQKKPDDGSMKGIAFIKDPDGYWIEVLNAKDARNFFSK